MTAPRRYRSSTIDAARPMLRSELSATGDDSGSTNALPLIPEDFPDGVLDRICRRRRRGRLRRRRGCEVLTHAVVLLPTLERVVELHRLPLRVPVVGEPAHVRGQDLGESADVVTVETAEIEGHQHRLDGHRRQRLA